jgi:hypothetical protein
MSDSASLVFNVLSGAFLIMFPCHFQGDEEGDEEDEEDDDEDDEPQPKKSKR